jgi:hypothetical protein
MKMQTHAENAGVQIGLLSGSSRSSTSSTDDEGNTIPHHVMSELCMTSVKKDQRAEAKARALAAIVYFLVTIPNANTIFKRHGVKTGFLEFLKIKCVGHRILKLKGRDVYDSFMHATEQGGRAKLRVPGCSGIWKEGACDATTAVEYLYHFLPETDDDDDDDDDDECQMTPPSHEEVLNYCMSKIPEPQAPLEPTPEAAARKQLAGVKRSLRFFQECEIFTSDFDVDDLLDHRVNFRVMQEKLQEVILLAEDWPLTLASLIINAHGLHDDIEEEVPGTENANGDNNVTT